MDDVTAKVARQYTDYSYPKPVEDIAAAIKDGLIELVDPSAYGPIYWPEGPPRPDLAILVAGCGTQQAAITAFKNPGAKVVGVDLSEASLGHQRYLRGKHGLGNLQLYQGDLCHVGAIGQDFDLIISTGVLHHLPDPSRGLSALASVLRPEGVMGLMVYGAAGRAGVYMLQDAFRRMGLGQSEVDVARVRRVLETLPSLHPAQTYIKNAAELAEDTAIVDTFLHPQDRAYTVPQLLQWLDDSGLALQTWAQNQFYYPEALIETAAREAIQALPDQEQWAIVEGLLGVPGNHIFVATRKGEERRIDFAGDDLFGYRPRLRQEAGVVESRPDGGGTLGLWGIRYDLGPAELAATGLIDGQRTLAEIISNPAFAHAAPTERLEFGRKLTERLWKLGVLMLQR